MKKSIKCDSFVFEHLFYEYISYDYIIVTNGEFCGKIKNGKFYFKHNDVRISRNGYKTYLYGEYKNGHVYYWYGKSKFRIPFFVMTFCFLLFIAFVFSYTVYSGIHFYVNVLLIPFCITAILYSPYLYYSKKEMSILEKRLLEICNDQVIMQSSDI